MGFFSDQAVHSFQLKLLRTEINQARSEEKKIDDDLAKAREVVRRGIDEQWWPSIAFYLKLQARIAIHDIKDRHEKKLKKLAERQDRPLMKVNDKSVRALDGIELPKWVHEVLGFGPKHPVRDRFNELHFLADIDNFLSELKSQKVPGENYVKLKLPQNHTLNVCGKHRRIEGLRKPGSI